jgi:hypothetical protein
MFNSVGENESEMDFDQDEEGIGEISYQER